MQSRTCPGHDQSTWPMGLGKPPLNSGCPDFWCWDRQAKSHEVVLYGQKELTAQFHPTWSNGTAAVRGTKPLNRGPPIRTYWEVKISDRIFGTSMMFGIGTRKCRLHADSFVNIIGEDNQGWGLSHKGLLWHNGEWIHFTRPFSENISTTIGLLFDAKQGSLSYFRDGHFIGIAFTGLDQVRQKLYPIISSTAAKTEMSLINMRRDFFSLQDLCRKVILENVHDQADLGALRLPFGLKKFVQRSVEYDDGDDTDEEQFGDPDELQWSKNDICAAFSNARARVIELPKCLQF